MVGASWLGIAVVMADWSPWPTTENNLHLVLPQVKISQRCFHHVLATQTGFVTNNLKKSLGVRHMKRYDRLRDQDLKEQARPPEAPSRTGG